MQSVGGQDCTAHVFDLVAEVMNKDASVLTCYDTWYNGITVNKVYCT